MNKIGYLFNKKLASYLGAHLIILLASVGQVWVVPSHDIPTHTTSIKTGGR